MQSLSCESLLASAQCRLREIRLGLAFLTESNMSKRSKLLEPLLVTDKNDADVLSLASRQRSTGKIPERFRCSQAIVSKFPKDR